MTRSTHSTPTRTLALLLLGAAISSGVVAAPTPSPMSSSALSTRAQNLQSRSSPPEQGLVSDLQRRGVENVKLVSRTGETGQDQKEFNKAAFRNLDLNEPGPALSSSTHRSGTETLESLQYKPVEMTPGWMRMRTDEQSRILKQLCTDQSLLREILLTIQSPDDPRLEQYQDKFKDILEHAEQAVKVGVPVDPWKVSSGDLDPFNDAMKIHAETLKYIPASQKFKRDAHNRILDYLTRKGLDVYQTEYLPM
ncbi:hypothetical protein FB446DRAFT_793204 [Lentinula raphanica]|nr:hypothetical protein FB446DRAFT_793204 [Lentinula raphanica]